MRVLPVVLVFAFAGLLAVDLQSSAAPRAAVATPRPTRSLAYYVREPQTVEIAFVKSGWIVRVERTVPRGITAQEFALR